MKKYKAKTYDGKEIVGTDIRLGSFFSHWIVHEYGETRIDPETIEVIEEGENNAATEQ